MPGVQAWELLNNPDYSGRLAMGELLKLLLRAGYSYAVSQKVASERGWQRLNAGEVM